MTTINAATLFLLTAVAWLSWVDARTLRLPDIITLPLAVFGLIVNATVFEAGWPAVAGLVLGYGSFLGIEAWFRRFRNRDGLGRGDAKLFAAGGAWCTAWFLPIIALIGTGLGLGYLLLWRMARQEPVSLQQKLAFGPWLALGIAISWIWRVYIGHHPYPI